MHLTEVTTSTLLCSSTASTTWPEAETGAGNFEIAYLEEWFIGRSVMQNVKNTSLQFKIVQNTFYWVPPIAGVRKLGIRGQREFSIPGILDESQLHFFSLNHEKWFSEVSISSRNMRVTKWNLVLVSKYENGHVCNLDLVSPGESKKNNSRSRLEKLHLLSRVRF